MLKMITLKTWRKDIGIDKTETTAHNRPVCAPGLKPLGLPYSRNDGRGCCTEDCARR
jgi:hypothetical protein